MKYRKLSSIPNSSYPPNILFMHTYTYVKPQREGGGKKNLKQGTDYKVTSHRFYRQAIIIKSDTLNCNLSAR